MIKLLNALAAIWLLMMSLPSHAAENIIGLPSHRYPEQFRLMQDERITASINEIIKHIDPDLKVIARECGQINAFYSPNQKLVTLCYEYMHSADQFIDRQYANQSIMTRSWLSVGILMGVLFHEFGHAIIDLRKVPIIGNQEDAADSIATIFLIEATKKSPAQGKVMIVGKLAYDWAQRSKGLDKLLFGHDLYANEHPLNEQRVFNMLCLAYGSNPALFTDTALELRLPQNRANRCQTEYQDTNNAIQQLLK